MPRNTNNGGAKPSVPSVGEEAEMRLMDGTSDGGVASSSRPRPLGLGFANFLGGLRHDDTVTPECDFATIDWAAEKELLGQRSDGLHSHRHHHRHWTSVTWDASQGWIAAGMVGVGTGLIAWCMEVTVQWITDRKFGFCRSRPWFSQEVCCRHVGGEVDCAEWVTWGEYFGLAGPLERELAAFGVYTLVALALAVTSAWLCKTFARYAAGSGIAEIKTILGGTHINRFLNGWTLLIKVVGLSLSVSSGLAVGKEGPYVHVASCVGNLVANLFAKLRTNESKRRELLSASAAAGVAVAFGAPIGGVLFSLEEASYFFPHKVMWRTFFCAVIATMTLHFTDPHGNGKIVMFQVNHHHAWRWFEFLPFTFVGILGGLVGGSFIFFNVKWSRFRKKSALKLFPLWEVAVLTLVTAVLQFPNPYMRGDMGENMALMFQDCKAGSAQRICSLDHLEYTRLLVAGLLKTILMVFTIGLKLPAGLFVPSLFTGACFGRLVGTLLKDFYDAYPHLAVFRECHHSPAQCVVPGVYAIIGAAAVLSGVTHMTICLAVIVFEITGDLELVLPVMLVVLTSKWVSQMIAGKSPIYVQHIRLNNYPFLDPKLEVDLPVSAHVLIEGQRLKVLTERGYTVADIESLLERFDYSGFPVVHDAESLSTIGYITRKNLQLALRKGMREHPLGPTTEVVFGDSARGAADLSRHVDDTEMVMDVSDYMDHAPIQADVNTSIQRVLHLFKSLGMRCCMVTQAGKLRGLITRKDLLSFIYESEKDPTGIAEVSAETESSESDVAEMAAPETSPSAVVRVRRSHLRP